MGDNISMYYTLEGLDTLTDNGCELVRTSRNLDRIFSLVLLCMLSFQGYPQKWSVGDLIHCNVKMEIIIKTIITVWNVMMPYAQ